MGANRILKEPPGYKIHLERKGWRKVWVITKGDKLQAIMTKKSLAHSWVNKQKNS